MTTIQFVPAVAPAPVTSHQRDHVTYERHLGVRAALGLIVHPFAIRKDALEVLLRSVERQAHLAGCGRVELEVPR